MITDAAKKYLAEIKDEGKYYETLSRDKAVDFALEGKDEDKKDFHMYKRLSAEYELIYKDLCTVLDAVEQELLAGRKP